MSLFIYFIVYITIVLISKIAQRYNNFRKNYLMVITLVFVIVPYDETTLYLPAFRELAI